MKKWLLLPVLLIALLISPVVATVLNTSVIYDGASNDNSENVVYGTRSYLFDAPANRAIVFQTLQMKESGTTTFAYKLANGNSITGSIIVTQTGIFSTTYVITINGGSTSTTSSMIGIPARYAMLVVDSSTQLYYFAISERVERNSGFFWYKLDTTTDSYIQLSSPPATDPIVSASLLASSPIDVTTGTNTFAVLSNNQQVMATWTPGDPTTTLGKLIQTISATISALLSFFKGVETYLKVILYMGSILFATEVFLTLNAAYIIIHAILAVHDSDSLFKSLSKFSRAMVKLMKFYADIFKYIKDTLQWW